MNGHAGLVLVPVAPKAPADSVPSAVVWDSSVLVKQPNATQQSNSEGKKLRVDAR